MYFYLIGKIIFLRFAEKNVSLNVFLIVFTILRYFFFAKIQLFFLKQFLISTNDVQKIFEGEELFLLKTMLAWQIIKWLFKKVKKQKKQCKLVYFNDKYIFMEIMLTVTFRGTLLFFFKNLCVTLFPTLGFGSSLMDVSIAPVLPSRYSNSFSVRFIPRNSRGPTNWPFRVPWTINK